MAPAGDDQEERVVEGEGADTAIEIALASDGLIEEPGFKGEEFGGPLLEEEILDERVALDGVFDVCGAGFDDFPDPGLPGWRNGEFAGVDVVLAGVARDLFLTGRRDGTFGEASVGSAGGEPLFSHAD